MTTLAATTVSAPELAVSEHCVCRFQEWVRPTLDRDLARTELHRLLGHGSLRPEPPSWLAARQRVANPADLFLVIGDEIVLPVRRCGDGFVAVTCLVRTGISEAARAMRNKHERAVRSRRRSRREGGRRSERRRGR